MAGSNNHSARTTAPDKLQPHNIEAEEAVLGALLIDPDAIIRVATFLEVEAFFLHKHRWVYEAIQTLHERRDPTDLVTLTDELDRQSHLDDIGGPAFLTDLINATPTSIHVEYYARIVERTAVLRRLIEGATQIAQLAYEDVDDVEEIIDRAESIIFGVSEQRTTRDLKPIRQAIDQYYDRIEYLSQHQGEVVGIPTGLKDLDKLLGGMQRSDLLILAGRPGMGKTSLGLSIALQAARKWDKRIAVFSLEMSDEQLVQRLLSAETGIDSQRLRLGQVHDDEWPVLIQATGILADTSIFIDDTPAISVLELRTKARRLEAEFGLDLLIVDYLQLMRGNLRSENRQQEISFISRSLKELARELKVPVLALSQLSRAVESRHDKRPMLSDLRESGCLTGDTLVSLADGRQTPICKVQLGDKVLSLNERTLKIEPSLISNKFSTGIKPVYKLITALGRTIRATGNHKFRTPAGWVRLDKLNINQHIAVPRRIITANKQTMSDAKLALLGHLIGDGCVLPRHAIQYTTKEPDLAEHVANLATDVFGDSITPRINPERNWLQVYLPASFHLTHNKHNPITLWFKELGIYGLRSHEKFVPDAVFTQPDRAVAIFLKSLWSTDGSIRRVYGKSPRASIYYATSSNRLAYQVQHLLLRLEINARVAEIPQGNKGMNQYHVIVSGKPDIEHFAKTIGTTGEYKSKSLIEIQAFLDTKKHNTNRDVITPDLWVTKAKNAMQQQGITHRQLYKELGTAYAGTTIFKQNVSRERLAKIADITDSTNLNLLAKSDIYWDKIVSIEPDGKEEVFDLTIPDNHNFSANNIIAHNSIEQDADVVMFVYRDEVYNADTEFPNIAEIIVGKHRSGPTGIFSVYFKKQLAQFVDLEIRTQALDY